MRKYLSDTKEMVNQGKYKEALERTIWFHEHVLEHDKAMAGVRLSFALSDWKSLGNLYPPAITAFIEMRDRKTRQILDNGGTLDSFGEVTAFNRELGENSKTVELFQTLTQVRPDFAKECWIFAKTPLFDEKRFDIIRNYIGSPLREFNFIKERYEYEIGAYKNDKVGLADIKAVCENQFVENNLQLIQYALAVDDLKSAKEIQQKALSILDDYRLREAIPSDKK